MQKEAVPVSFHLLSTHFLCMTKTYQKILIFGVLAEIRNKAEDLELDSVCLAHEDWIIINIITIIQSGLCTCWVNSPGPITDQHRLYVLCA